MYKSVVVQSEYVFGCKCKDALFFVVMITATLSNVL